MMMRKSTVGAVWRRSCALLLASLLLGCASSHADQQMVGSWGTAPAGPPLPAASQGFTDQTLRLIVRTSIAGSAVRVRLSNQYGSTPLVVQAAHVALRDEGARIVAATDRVLHFAGATSVTVAPGAALLSDPVALALPAQTDLAVSLYLPQAAPASTLHELGYQTNYVSVNGDFAAVANLPVARTITFWPFLTDVEVLAPQAGAIVALGDSITDGAITPRDANLRWPDLLAARLRAEGVSLGVVNRGLSGNRLLRDASVQPLFGVAALRRFDNDVLATAGLRYLIVLIGINEIGHPGSSAIPASETVTVQELIAGYQQLIARAHALGVQVFGATLTPFENTSFRGYYTPEKEATRQAVNDWIRRSAAFDAVIDFDLAMRDPQQPTRLLPAFDSGDHLHPNAAGAQAMANAIALDLFRSASSRAADATAPTGLAPAR